MSNRDIIFGKIANGLHAGRDDGARRRTVEDRIGRRVRHPTPDRVAGKTPGQHLALFEEYLTGQSATVLEADAAADVPSLVAGYLRQNNLPARLAMGEDAYLAALPWNKEPAIERKQGRAQPTDEVGLAHAVAGVAETGTLMLASGADNPVTINFLPETYIVVVESKDIVGPYEDGWNKIRARFGDRAMPRTVNMISGPSRTADVGGKLVTGAHGPRRMCVIVVKG
jgi:L-lactate dehydrogenase complex protein LldG